MFLLDTCTLVWITSNETKLSKNAVQILESENSKIYTSIVSFWELGIKGELEGIKIESNLKSFFLKAQELFGLELLNLDIDSCDLIRKLPQYHKDPFDRMLIAQGIINDLTIITCDKFIHKYPVKVIW